MFKNMGTQELYRKIRNWEHQNGEAFTDYFMHDNVKDGSWAFWLLGKGYTERSNIIIDLLAKGEKCICQSLLYEVNSSIVEEDYGTPNFEHELFNEQYDKDVMLWAEFLTSNKYYYDKTIEFFDKYNV